MANKSINAGKYRHRITIVRAPDDSSRNDYGQRTGQGASVDTVWAAKEDWGGRELDELGRETTETTTKFKIRWRNDVDTTMHVVFGAESYDIESVLDFDGTRRELVLVCKKVT